jgi:3-oxoacyl-[acyl-carrier protein] reductase
MKLMVVTGASTGVGRATCLRFAAEGYTVCALARSADKLEKLRTQAGSGIAPYPTDVSDSERVSEAFNRILAEHGTPDVLVNNAGITSGGKPVEPALIDAIIDINLKGAMYCTFAVLPRMQERKSGRIINVASIAGVDISESGSDGLYAASKHGMVAFADALGRKVRKDGVLVTTLCPGGIDTPLWSEDNPYPHGREAMIRPEEVADLIAYVLSQPERTLFKNVIFVPTVEKW